MPLIDVSRFPGIAPDYSGYGALGGGIAQGINQAIGRNQQMYMRQAEREEERHFQAAQGEMNSASLQAAQMRDMTAKYANGSNQERQKAVKDVHTQAFRLANDAIQRGFPNVAKQYQQLATIDNYDELNTALASLELKAVNVSDVLTQRAGQRMAAETYVDVTDSQGRVIGQRNTVTNQVVADPRAPQFAESGVEGLEGYVFNKTDGSYILNPELRLLLDANAEALAKQEGMLDSKDIVGVNDKVTALTKDIDDIVSAAKSLETLQGRGTPAAQIAAVFKFMKAMDPSSTVRESETETVYSAEGAAKGLANKLNALLGEGGLSEAGFADLVDTAKALANTAIGTAKDSVNGYLNVLADKMTLEDLTQMQSRVPKPFKITLKALEDYTVEELNALPPEQLLRLKQRAAGQ